jgi:hypothetical protein
MNTSSTTLTASQTRTVTVTHLGGIYPTGTVSVSVSVLLYRGARVTPQFA